MPEVGQPFNPYRLWRGLFIPDPIAQHQSLTPLAKMTFGVLYRYAGGKEDCFPSLETIGTHLGLKERQTRDYIRELEQAGFIQVRRQQRQPNTYAFVWHQDFEDQAFSFEILDRHSSADQDLDRQSTVVRPAESRRLTGNLGSSSTNEPNLAESTTSGVPGAENACRGRDNRKDNRKDNMRGSAKPTPTPPMPYAEMGRFDHFLDKYLRFYDLRGLSPNVRNRLEEYDGKAADKEAFRAGLVDAIHRHATAPDGTLSQDIGAYVGVARGAIRQHSRQRFSAKSTPAIQAADACMDEEKILSWLKPIKRP